MTRQPGARDAFTLIEMVIVISIIVSLLAIGVPALINAQGQADDFATQNVIESVHNTCRRNAMQFGSAGVTYGFTLTYTANISGTASSDTITPWVTDGASTTYNTPGSTLQADFGKTPLWSGDDMKFWDRYRPAGTYTVDAPASATAAATDKYLYVGYEPRTGLPHVYHATAAIDPKTQLAPGTISATTSMPNSLSIKIYSTRGQAQSSVLINKTGVCNAHAGL